ncbi:TPA: hypothetical protein ND652_004635 [Klebsiella aerogenes]|nr:hypothetical protein [Klebsiella aerogenes]
MAINDKDLLGVGFSKQEVENLKNRLNLYNGTMENLISVLSRRFRVSFWITIALILVMVVTILSGSSKYIISGSIGGVIVLIIAWGTFPPIMGWKAARLQKIISRQAQ